jgi:hypothetical protein
MGNNRQGYPFQSNWQRTSWSFKRKDGPNKLNVALSGKATGWRWTVGACRLVALSLWLAVTWCNRASAIWNTGVGLWIASVAWNLSSRCMVPVPARFHCITIHVCSHSYTCLSLFPSCSRHWWKKHGMGGFFVHFCLFSSLADNTRRQGRTCGNGRASCVDKVVVAFDGGGRGGIRVA